MILARADQASRRYGDVLALDRVDLEVRAGELVGLLLRERPQWFEKYRPTFAQHRIEEDALPDEGLSAIGWRTDNEIPPRLENPRVLESDSLNGPQRTTHEQRSEERGLFGACGHGSGREVGGLPNEPRW